MSETVTSIRILARGSDGQMFSYAWDDIPEEHMSDNLEDAIRCMRDREATWHPEGTFHEDERALFAWRHMGWGIREGREWPQRDIIEIGGA